MCSAVPVHGVPVAGVNTVLTCCLVVNAVLTCFFGDLPGPPPSHTAACLLAICQGTIFPILLHYQTLVALCVSPPPSVGCCLYRPSRNFSSLSPPQRGAHNRHHGSTATAMLAYGPLSNMAMVLPFGSRLCQCKCTNALSQNGYGYEY